VRSGSCRSVFLVIALLSATAIGQEAPPSWSSTLPNATFAPLIGEALGDLTHLYAGAGCNGPELAYLPDDSCFRGEDHLACPSFALPEPAGEALAIQRPTAWILTAEGVCRPDLGPLTLVSHGDNCLTYGSNTGYALAFPLIGCATDGIAPMAILGDAPPAELRWVPATSGPYEPLHQGTGPTDPLLAKQVMPWWQRAQPSAEALLGRELRSRAQRTSARAAPTESLELLRATFVTYDPSIEWNQCASAYDETYLQWGLRTPDGWHSAAGLDMESLSGIGALDGRVLLAVAAGGTWVEVYGRTGATSFEHAGNSTHHWIADSYELDPFFYSQNEFYCGP
jgi:hypothetical protein